MVLFNNLMRMSPRDTVTHLYPKLYSILNMQDPLIETIDDEEYEFPLPQPLNLTSSNIEKSGIYLLYDTHSTIIYIGKSCEEEKVHEIFNNDFTLNLENPISKRVDDIIKELNSFHSVHGSVNNLFLFRL
jgi:hypothetical protein